MKKKYTIIISLLVMFSMNTCKKPLNRWVNNHSYSNPNEVTLSHLTLSLKVDFEQKKLRGYAEWKIENHAKANNLWLDVGNLKIEKVLVDGDSSIAYATTDPVEIFGAALAVAIKPESKKVKIYYETAPDAEALQWLLPEQTNNKQQPFLFTQSQAILARTWVPCMDVPSVRFTYDAEIECPSHLFALMSATNPKEKSPEGKYQFNMNRPIASYLLALAVGDIVYKDLGSNCGVYAEPNMLEKAAYEFADLESMIQSASELYGPYAWDRYDILVLPSSFPFGGMENPKLTFATPTIITGDRSLVSLVAHELAHSWSGNLVTNATWNDFWLNEGFTVYFEQRIMEKLYGKDYAEMMSAIALDELKLTINDYMEKYPEDTRLAINLEGRNPDDGVSDIAYEKGRFFLRKIEETVGRPVWDSFLNGYFTKYAFKTVTTREFYDYLHSNLLKNNKKWQKEINVSEWLYGEGLPENCPEIISVELNKVNQEVEKFKTKHNALELQTTGWTTHHWLHFLRNLPKSVSVVDMQTLDTQFKFTQSGNAEILCDWFKIVIENQYKPSYPALEKFLIAVGRRKFLTPLYSRLVATEDGKEFAKKVFEKAKKGYHSVSANTIHQMLEQ